MCNEGTRNTHENRLRHTVYASCTQKVDGTWMRIFTHSIASFVKVSGHFNHLRSRLSNVLTRLLSVCVCVRRCVRRRASLFYPTSLRLPHALFRSHLFCVCDDDDDDNSTKQIVISISFEHLRYADKWQTVISVTTCENRAHAIVCALPQSTTFVRIARNDRWSFEVDSHLYWNFNYICRTCVTCPIVRWLPPHQWDHAVA